jgi:hypothetical protein
VQGKSAFLEEEGLPCCHDDTPEQKNTIVGDEKFAPDYVYEYQYDAQGNWITRIKKRVPLPYAYEDEVTPDGRLETIQKMKTKQTVEEEKRSGRYEEKTIRTIVYYER